MEIWYEPTNGQVMAVYSSRYSGSVWQDAGYLEAESAQALTRDHRVTVSDGKVTAAVQNANPVRPAVSDQVLEDRAKQALINQLLETELAKPVSAIPAVEALRAARR